MHLKQILNKAILFFLALQVISVSISIAVSSIAFGIWATLWLVKIIHERKISYDRNLFAEIKLINIFILLYCIFEIISRFTAIYPEGAFNNLKRLLLFLIFYVSIIEITDFRTLTKILLVNICVLSLVSVIELVQYALKFAELAKTIPFSEIRIDYFNHPITSAEIKMMSLLSLFPLLFIKEKFFIARKYILLILIPVFIAMMLTQTRNVMLSTLICFIVFGIAANKKFLIAVILTVIIAAIALPSSYTDRAKSIFDMNHLSNRSRISMWRVGFEMFRDHPLTGIGDSHIREIYVTYKTPEEASEGSHLHNNFMMILATTGIFGFICFLTFFVLIFLKQIKFYLRNKDPLFRSLTLGSILVMISFQISGIFDWNFGDHEVVTLFFFLISVPFVIFKFNETRHDNSLQDNSPLRLKGSENL